VLEFHAVAEPRPGARFQERFQATWPAYSAWYLRDGDAARPSYLACRHALELHMPELVHTWERLVDLAGGGDLAARMLSLWDPPPLVTGCSQAVFARPEPLLVRNYDFDPKLLEGVITRTELTGRPVIGMSDCLWGLLDGVNDAGLAISLTFGGRPDVGEGFAIPIVVRYVLETCSTVAEARAALERIPVHAPQNLTLLDRSGDFLTAYVGPGRPPSFHAVAATTNHQGRVEWPEYAAAIRSEEREACVVDLLADPEMTRERFVAAFLEPPLRSTQYAAGFGTLYTAAYHPAEGRAEFSWPGASWELSLDDFQEGSRTARIPSSNAAQD
jgi:predicted choloylglycine hydrolase